MANSALTVESVVVGRPSSAALPPVQLKLASERVTVREIIRCAVREQVERLLREKQMDARNVRAALERQYLSEADVHDQVLTGKVRFPSEADGQVPSIDVEVETERAFDGFRSRAFRVLIDDQAAEDLDREFIVHPRTTVTFLRLVPLAGG